MKIHYLKKDSILKLYNYNVDGIRLKKVGDEIENLNMDALKEHPRLKNTFQLSDRLSDRYHVNNIKIYKAKNYIQIDTSLPYLYFGHNHISLSSVEAFQILQELSQVLNVGLDDAEIIEMEYGAFMPLDRPLKEYLPDILGVRHMNLIYSKDYIKVFAMHALAFKIYDPIVNAKRKKVYSISQFQDPYLAKIELKSDPGMLSYSDAQSVSDLNSSDLDIRFRASVVHEINALHILNSEVNLNGGSTMTEILFAALKSLEEKFETPVENFIKQVISKSSLSPSQKSKRYTKLMSLGYDHSTRPNDNSENGKSKD
ncbi:hypothetical protein [Aegicerativicinus sediminis]|uniref:hypothetical protein n=1 Tax=Aegicerativicinus sediminis TaxID=2893202 RepID=UPI001E5E42C9|nr:hypothetical protein [Aegicerativicinus sediminis]